MGLFAQAFAAMPLPPAQAEAIYDLSLDEEQADTVGAVSGESELSLRQSRRTVGATPEAKRDHTVKLTFSDKPAIPLKTGGAGA